MNNQKEKDITPKELGMEYLKDITKPIQKQLFSLRNGFSDVIPAAAIPRSFDIIIEKQSELIFSELDQLMTVNSESIEEEYYGLIGSIKALKKYYVKEKCAKEKEEELAEDLRLTDPRMYGEEEKLLTQEMLQEAIKQCSNPCVIPKPILYKGESYYPEEFEEKIKEDKSRELTLEKIKEAIDTLEENGCGYNILPEIQIPEGYIEQVEKDLEECLRFQKVSKDVKIGSFLGIPVVVDKSLCKGEFKFR